jgi:hypothetical protein
MRQDIARAQAAVSANSFAPPEGSSKGVSASFRRFAPSSKRALFPRNSRFPLFPPFPPLPSRSWTSRPPSERVVQAREASMVMNIMPILCRPRSAGIRHNIAQFCQAGWGKILEEVRMRSSTCFVRSGPMASIRSGHADQAAHHFAIRRMKYQTAAISTATTTEPPRTTRPRRPQVTGSFPRCDIRGLIRCRPWLSVAPGPGMFNRAR